MHWSSARRIAHPAAWVLLALAAVAPHVSAQPVPAQTAPAPASRFVAVLDAAHGGDDTGATLTSGQMEKAATLALSVRLRSLLSARGMAVVTTRESDLNLVPDKRAEIANHARAQLCLSLHATESGSGVHLYTSSLPPAPQVHFPAWKTAQGAWVLRSLAAAGVLNSALLHAGMNVTLGRTSLPGLDSMTCPAVAVEIAPERGPDNAITAQPDDPAYQARVASTLAAALLEWRTEARQP